MLFSFAIGAYTWKIQQSAQKTAAANRIVPIKADKEDGGAEFHLRPILAVVNGESISFKELEWEYNLHVQGAFKGIFQDQKLTPIPDLGHQYHKEMAPLKQRLASSIVERKILYNFVKQDTSFDSSEARRYTDCVTAWQNSLDPKNPLLSGSENEERLKTRLCEQSLILQYANEKVLAKIDVSQQEIEEYFRSNKSKFETPDRVIVRQILLADETTANQVRSQVHPGNFAELAKKHSIAPEASEGGLLGPIEINLLPHVFDVIYSMHPGSISNVLKSNYGFHIIMFVEKQPKSDARLSEATPKIKATLKQQKSEEEYQKWLQLALDTIPVTAPKPIW